MLFSSSRDGLVREASSAAPTFVEQTPEVALHVLCHNACRRAPRHTRASWTRT
ncbi:MAG: hypothetical protein IPN45_08590 [Actinomycetales bacterium]|nr:hypothetical protein [Actinomycetales bacterium]